MKPSQRAIVLLEAAQEIIDQEARFLPADPKATGQYIALTTASRLVDNTIAIMDTWEDIVS